MQTLHAVLAAAIRLSVALALIAAPWANPATAASLAVPSDTATVHVGNNGGFTYSPTPQTIAVGDTVHWVWDGSFHSVTSGSCSPTCTPDGKWTDSGINNAGFTFDVTFTQTGTYNYYCTNHGQLFGMRATIQVVDFLPISGLSAANSSPTVLGSATDFTATISAGNSVTYTWSFGDGQGNVGALASHVYNSTGFYTAVVTASNPISTVVATTPVSVTRNFYLPLIVR